MVIADIRFIITQFANTVGISTELVSFTKAAFKYCRVISTLSTKIGKSFVTMNETWIHHHLSETKQRLKWWTGQLWCRIL